MSSDVISPVEVNAHDSFYDIVVGRNIQFSLYREHLCWRPVDTQPSAKVVYRGRGFWLLYAYGGAVPRTRRHVWNAEHILGYYPMSFCPKSLVW